MFETPITVTGKVVSDVTTRVTTTGAKVADFRILCQERRYDRENDTWSDGDSLFMRVTGWRTLAEGMGALERGDRVVVSGRLKVREYTGADGTSRTTTEIDARAVGPDLAFHTVVVNRRAWASDDQLALVGRTGQPAQPEEEAADAA